MRKYCSNCGFQSDVHSPRPKIGPNPIGDRFPKTTGAMEMIEFAAYVAVVLKRKCPKCGKPLSNIR
jgi:ribosomal protein S27AE